MMEAVAEKNEFYKVEEVAVILRVCTSTIRTRVKSGEIPCLRLGEVWRIPKKWVDEKVGSLGGGAKDGDE